MSQQLFATAVHHALGDEAQPRQAALLLGAMSASDRAWVLARLPTADRAILEPLLGELDALGIPVDADLLDAVLEKPARGESAEPGSTVPRDAADTAAVLNAAPAALLKLLAHEPAGLIARLLGMRAWPWQQEFMKLLPASKAAEVRNCLERDAISLTDDSPGPAVAPLWQAAMMRCLRFRLEEAEPSAGTIAPQRQTPPGPVRGHAWWRWGSVRPSHRQGREGRP